MGSLASAVLSLLSVPAMLGSLLDDVVAAVDVLAGVVDDVLASWDCGAPPP